MLVRAMRGRCDAVRAPRGGARAALCVTYSLSTFRDDDLAIEAELVAPVLTVERPDDVLLVGTEALQLLGLGLGDLAGDDLLIELVSLGSGDVDDDLFRVAEVFVELVQVALVALAGQRAGVADGEVAG